MCIKDLTKVMKKVIWLFTIVILNINMLHAQIGINEINIEMDSFSKIFSNTNPAETKLSNAKEWVAKTYGDYKAVLQLEDEANCKLIIKGINKLPSEQSIEAKGAIEIIRHPQLRYTLTIDCKDDKYRIKLENIRVEIKQLFYVIGSPTTSTRTYNIDEFYFNEDILKCETTINESTTQLKLLKAQDTNSMNKKEIRAYRKEISNEEEKLATAQVQKEKLEKQKEIRMINLKKEIYNLVNSLIKSIESNDNF